MPINENILMQNLVPDLASSVAKGLAIGREIKEAPYRNRLLQLQTQQAEQQAQVAEMEKGIAQAQGVAALLGDMTREDLLNPEVYNSVVSQLPTFTGQEVKPENQVVNHRSVDELIRLRDAAINQAKTARGNGFDFQFIGGGEIVPKLIGTNDDGKEVYQNVKIFTRGNRSTGDVESVEQPIGNEFVGLENNPLSSKKITEEQIKSDIKVSEEERKKDIERDVSRDIEVEKGTGKKLAEREAGLLDVAYSAADSLPNLKRTMELLNVVETGGWDAKARLYAKQVFGVESADEGELSNNLGKAVLSQLKATFGSAFTEQEGQRLTDLEAGIGKNTETNKRIIQKAMKMAEVAANRGITIAEKRGLKDDAQRLRDALDYSFDFNQEFDSVGNPDDTRTEEEILKEYGI